MNKLKFFVSAGLIGLLTVTAFFGCKEKDDSPATPSITTPVLDKDFTVTVTGNNVVFTSKYDASIAALWTGVDDASKVYGSSLQVYNLVISKKGTYKFTLTVTDASGNNFTSEPFTVTIEKDDLSFLNYGVWKKLSGGAGKTKSWRMDMRKLEGADQILNSIYFDGPVFYSGYENADKTVSLPYWSWDVLTLPVTVNGVEQTSFFNWSPAYKDNGWLMAANNYGTITFKGDDMTASTSKFGVSANGAFSFDTATMKLTLTNVTLPIDTARVNEGQFPDPYHLRVYSISDSAIQIGIKRVYEGKNTDGTPKESKWTMIYNFICSDYTWAEPKPEVFTYTEPVKTSFTKADLVGTWKYDVIAFDWIGWIGIGDKGTTTDAKRLNSYTDAASIVALGWAATQAQLTAAYAQSFVFNADGTCTINGIANTYSVTDGVITFGTALGSELGVGAISVTGTTAKIVDVKSGVGFDTGIWIGNQNGAKNESACVHLVKSTKKK